MSIGVRISIVIPTYRREQALVQTLEHLLQLPDHADEILVIDQTAQHEPGTAARLEVLHAQGAICWQRQQPPSITAAMNRGLRTATSDVVLFLDDDIAPEPTLVSAHRQVHIEHANTLIAGRVIQPWEERDDLATLNSSRFAAYEQAWIDDFMGGNFSVRRAHALALGGFDENFVGAAYRFEAEFAHRFRASGGSILFQPNACLHHLRVGAGGTRSYGEHLTTWKPHHTVGAYYFALRTKCRGRWVYDFLGRPMCAIATRHHLRRPWWIPATLVAELRGMIWAARLNQSGPKLIGPPSHDA